jgi:predicted nuclease of predicted toxin-antitoxin system
MRFFVDAQLPPALARWIAANGHDASHVSELKLADASDRAIWKHAGETGAVIISKDEDFARMSKLMPGPAVVWVTSGNTRKQELLRRMELIFPQIVSALESGERLIEVR